MNTTRLNNNMDLLDMSIFAYSIKDESIINDFMKEFIHHLETIVKFIHEFERRTLNNENMNIDLCNAFQELKESIDER
jgi:hypothetical protein